MLLIMKFPQLLQEITALRRCTILPSPLLKALPPQVPVGVGTYHLLQQCRYRNHNNSVSILQQFYNRLPIRKKYRRALRRGTLIWDKGQVKIPPIGISGFDAPVKCLTPYEKAATKQYGGKFENLRASRVWFQD